MKFDVPCKLCGAMITRQPQEATGSGHIIGVAEMLDERRFEYGISGVFVFKRELGLKAGDSICNPCLFSREGEFEEEKSVKCSNCGALYQPCWDGHKSGWGCSGAVVEREGVLKVWCGWGSRYDTDSFTVEVPVVKLGDTVCDKCIDAFLEEGSLALVHQAHVYHPL